jgi:hypothetical protein
VAVVDATALESLVAVVVVVDLRVRPVPVPWELRDKAIKVVTLLADMVAQAVVAQAVMAATKQVQTGAMVVRELNGHLARAYTTPGVVVVANHLLVMQVVVVV